MHNITKVFFQEIGISKGMTVLDIGCGRGVTTELLLEIVGLEGKVVGLDSDNNAIRVAMENAKSKNLGNVEYILSDLMNIDLGKQKFDAIVGRRILKYLPNPKEVIGNLLSYLNINGIMGFQEHDSTNLINAEKMPLHSKVNNWIWKLVENNGGNINIGKELWNIFNNDLISIKNIKSEPIIQTPTNDISLTNITKTLSGLLIAKNIVSEQEIIDSNLFENLELEKRESNSIFIRELIFFVTAKRI